MLTSLAGIIDWRDCGVLTRLERNALEMTIVGEGFVSKGDVFDG